MVKLVNRAKMSTATTGTGTITLGTAEDGYQSFASAGVADGDVVRYVIEDGTDWEIGTGTYTATGTTLTRTVSESSNSDEAITLSGTAVVFVSAVAKDISDSLGTVDGSDLDLSTGTVFEVTADDQTLTFSNPPAVTNFQVKLTGAGTVNGYDLANASYDAVSFNFDSQDGIPLGITFDNTGTKMYMVGNSNDRVYQYSLSTAYDISTMSYDSVSFSVASQGTTPHDITFNADGTKMYVLMFADQKLYQYSLSTAYDISIASYDSVSFDLSSQDSGSISIVFNNTGTKMFTTGNSNDRVYQYSLSTAYDISTMSYDSVSFSVASQDVSPYSLAFNGDGTRIFLLGDGNDRVYQYSLSTAYDISTMSYDSVSFSVASQDTRPYGIVFNDNGTKMYVVGDFNNRVHQYTTGTITPLTVTYPTSVKWPGGLVPETPNPDDVDILEFMTVDEGITYYGRLTGDNHR